MKQTRYPAIEMQSTKSAMIVLKEPIHWLSGNDPAVGREGACGNDIPC
jgi:hypothetical protein